MNNARVVLKTYNNPTEELYFMPKEGCYLEQKIVGESYNKILKIYNVWPKAKKKWYQFDDGQLVELVLTIDLANVKYIVYDE